jgi:cytochrome P450
LTGELEQMTTSPTADPPAPATEPPPGPKIPALLQTVLMGYGMGGFLDRCHRRYGDFFVVRTVMWGKIYVTVAPDDIKSVFTGSTDTFRFGEHARELGVDQIVGPQSLLFLDGEPHREQRRRVSAPFQAKAVRDNIGTIADIAAEEVATWPVGTPFQLLPHMREIAIQVILRIVIGASGERIDQLREILPKVANSPRVPMLFPPARKLPGWRRYERVRDEGRRLITAEIADRRRCADLSERTDILSMLVASEQESDQPMEDGALVDLMLLLLVAGHESSATALSWIFERLVRCPDVLARLRDALDGDDPAYTEALLDATVRETLRLRPVILLTSRRVRRPTTLGGHRIPAGALVMTASAQVHQSPKWFDQPERFRPERFLTDDIDTHAFVPFGGGPRRCLGANLAMVEMSTVLRAVLERVEFAPATTRGERPAPRHVTLTPSEGATVTVSRRLPVRDGVRCPREVGH